MCFCISDKMKRLHNCFQGKATTDTMALSSDLHVPSTEKAKQRSHSTQNKAGRSNDDAKTEAMPSGTTPLHGNIDTGNNDAKKKAMPLAGQTTRPM